MVQYKLHYFNLRGRAELARFVFAAAGQQYEDVRFEREQWPEFKANSPNHQVPMLEVIDGDNSFKLCQSVTIARYLARKFNLAGSNEQEQAIVDMYADQVTDLLNEFAKVHKETDADRKAEFLNKLTTEILPAQLTIFNNRLGQTGSGTFVPSGLTYADFFLAIVLDWLAEKKEPVLAHFSNVKKLTELVASHPKIAEWVAKRPVTEM